MVFTFVPQFYIQSLIDMSGQLGCWISQEVEAFVRHLDMIANALQVANTVVSVQCEP